MCGITGVLAFNSEGEKALERISRATHALSHRGPDGQRILKSGRAALGHTRLSVIDTSSASSQPFTDDSGRYTIVFNGEIFNYCELKRELEDAGVSFATSGDVEVLLKLVIRERENALNKLRGFFAFAVYDNQTEELFLARDRFGVKPLYFIKAKDCFAFASEVRSLLEYEFKLSLNTQSVYHYLQLNYVPGSRSIANEIEKLEPGTFLSVAKQVVQSGRFYSLETEIEKEKRNFSAENIEGKLRHLLSESVKDRMVADVPVGCFLSGGIDSTIIAGLASGMTSSLATFSLGFTGNKWFDESPYAETAARAFKTDHHTFMLSNEDLFEYFGDFLECIDEPFADSSALNVYILSRKTKPFVKTVLSGDGADELFAGYNKHRAEWLIRNSKEYRLVAGAASMFSSLFPKSRNSGFSNKMRQIAKFAAVMRLNPKQRYWKLASISSEEEAGRMMSAPFNRAKAGSYADHLLRNIKTESSLNDFLLTDVEIVLEGDMLVKVDRMSMANGLEVRNPFLDHRLVSWALALPEEFKINRNSGKLILKKAFASLIPAELLVRKKHGFEVPLHKWMKNELRPRLEREYLNEEFIAEQGIFSIAAVSRLKRQLFSDNPGDAPARAWALLLFNHWYKKYSSHFC